MMNKRGSLRNVRRSAKTGAVIGRDRFAKISAVEGVELTRDARKRAAGFDRRGLSAEERISAIVASYRKG